MSEKVNAIEKLPVNKRDASTATEDLGVVLPCLFMPIPSMTTTFLTDAKKCLFGYRGKQLFRSND
jgi:hypothetical protein